MNKFEKTILDLCEVDMLKSLIAKHRRGGGGGPHTIHPTQTFEKSFAFGHPNNSPPPPRIRLWDLHVTIDIDIQLINVDIQLIEIKINFYTFIFHFYALYVNSKENQNFRVHVGYFQCIVFKYRPIYIRVLISVNRVCVEKIKTFLFVCIDFIVWKIWFQDSYSQD